MKYELVVGDSVDELNKLVNEKLKEGYRLHGPGGVSIACNSRTVEYAIHIYFQTVKGQL